MRWRFRLSVVLIAVFVSCAAHAQAAQWPLGDDFLRAARSGDYRSALVALSVELPKCAAVSPSKAACFNLLVAAANTSRLAGDPYLAEELARDAVRVAVGSRSSRHEADGLTALGNALGTQGRFSGAEGAYRRAVSLLEGDGGTVAVDLAIARNNLGLSIQQQGRAAEAEAEFQKALDAFSSDKPLDRALRSTIYQNRALALRSLSRFAEAQRLLEEALKINRDIFPRFHPEIARVYSSLGSILQIQKRYVEAEANYRIASFRWEQAFPISHPSRIRGYWLLATNLEAQRKAPPAVRTLLHAAANGVLQRLSATRMSDRGWQTELRDQRPIFLAQVRTAWGLASDAR